MFTNLKWSASIRPHERILNRRGYFSTVAIKPCLRSLMVKTNKNCEVMISMMMKTTMLNPRLYVMPSYLPAWKYRPK